MNIYIYIYIYPCLQCSNPPSLPPYLVPLQPIVPCPAQQRGAVVPAVAVPPQRVELGGWSISATKLVLPKNYNAQIMSHLELSIYIYILYIYIYICTKSSYPYIYKYIYVYISIIYIYIYIYIESPVFFTKPTICITWTFDLSRNGRYLHPSLCNLGPLVIRSHLVL